MASDSRQDGATPQVTADPELEELLADACGAPPVPRSLLKRLDAGIEQEWGVSPRLAERQPARVARQLTAGARRTGRRARWFRAVPLTATLGLLVALGVIFNTNSGGYAWADMLQAIIERGVLQIDDEQGSRWLALEEGLVGEQVAGTSQLVDVRQQVVLRREADAATILRYQMSPQSANVDRDRLMVSFLLGETVGTEPSQRLVGLRLVDESWTPVADSRNEIALQARFAADDQTIELRLRLDADSRLPLTCEVVGLSVDRSLSLSYPTTDVREWRERSFPHELAVVDVDGPVTALTAPQATATAVAPVAPDPDNRVLSPVLPGPQAAVDSPTASSAANLLAATTTWAPVVISSLPENRAGPQVDAILQQLWDENGIEPAPPASDEELLRRVYLDLAGRTPSVNEVRAYLNDTAEDRYEQLVERLLASPDHASHLATVWRTFLIPEGVDLAAFGGVAEFDRWLAEWFASNQPYDELVRSLLLAEGRLSKSGPLLFYSAVKLDPDQLAARTARVFLGMRLECAQCHDHPFEPWTQEDFWSYAAFFAQISRPQGKLETVSTVMRVRDIDRGDVMLPETDTVVPPRFLDGTSLPPDEQVRRQQLAHWLTGTENPYFARAAANRVWGHLFGKGIIDPVDDFGLQNPPTSPELLELLAGHFIRTGFDLRELFRTVVLSRAYRLSSGAPTHSPQRLDLFAQMHVKTLTAEQVYDCISVATILESTDTADPYALNVARIGNTSREVFLQQFRTPAGRATEYQGGIPQALTLMNGRLIDGATGLSSSGLLSSLEAPFFTNEQRVEVLYFATLSRRPRPAEWELIKTYIPEDSRGTPLREGLSDLLWALLNSAEFTMNH